MSKEVRVEPGCNSIIMFIVLVIGLFEIASNLAKISQTLTQLAERI